MNAYVCVYVACICACYKMMIVFGLVNNAAAFKHFSCQGIDNHLMLAVGKDSRLDVDLSFYNFSDDVFHAYSCSGGQHISYFVRRENVVFGLDDVRKENNGLSNIQLTVSISGCVMTLRL